MKKTLVVVAVSALWTLPAGVWAHGSCDEDMEHCAYWHNSSGVYVNDSSGRCVRTGSWFEGSQVEGCDEMIPLDADGDGVIDESDNCPSTPKGAAVDMKGCQLDSDGDGVVDSKDSCPNTPAGTAVDMRGCALDSDGDGVIDAKDQCPATAQGVEVDSKGCKVVEMVPVTIKLEVKFASNSDQVTSAYDTQMKALAYVLAADSSSSVVINGHTDSAGAADYNLALSQRRADAVAKYLVDNYGVAANQITAVGHGETSPIADNGTQEGRRSNRRVEAELQGKVQK